MAKTQFEVRGTSAGKRIVRTIEASSEASAREKATLYGITVESVTVASEMARPLASSGLVASPVVSSNRPACIIVGHTITAIGMIGLLISILAILLEKFPRDIASVDPTIQRLNVVMYVSSAITSLFAIGFGTLLAAVGRLAHTVPDLLRDVARSK